MSRSKDCNKISARCHVRRRWLGMSLAAVLISLTTPAVLAASFGDFIGTWSGRGNAIFTGNAKESLLCKGYYTGSDDELSLALRCASASNKINMRAELTGNGANVRGTWEERTFNASGDVTGTMSGQRLKLKLDGGITGNLVISLGNDSQLISLNAQGTALSAVKLRLKRR